MNILAIIPARGGSKGIKRKNLVDLNGKELIAYSIEHAQKSDLINKIVVSTEDEEIKNVSLSYGAEVPFMRPVDLSGDQVLDIPVFIHALNYFKESENYIPDIVVHLRPTAPYRKSEWIDEAIDLLINNPSADSVRSVSEPEKHPYRMFTIDNEGYLNAIMQHEHPVPYLLRRQDLPAVYYYNCVIDVTRPETIMKKQSMTGDKILPYIMNANDVIDIDTIRDLDMAKLFFGKK